MYIPNFPHFNQIHFPKNIFLLGDFVWNWFISSIVCLLYPKSIFILRWTEQSKPNITKHKEDLQNILILWFRDEEICSKQFTFFYFSESRREHSNAFFQISFNSMIGEEKNENFFKRFSMFDFLFTTTKKPKLLLAMLRNVNGDLEKCNYIVRCGSEKCSSIHGQANNFLVLHIFW